MSKSNTFVTFCRNKKSFDWIQTFTQMSKTHENIIVAWTCLTLNISIFAELQLNLDRVRAWIAPVRGILDTSADSILCFLSICTHILAVGAIFTSQNHPKCKFDSHFGWFGLVEMAPATSSDRSLTVIKKHLRLP